jgi:hypothetical protein
MLDEVAVVGKPPPPPPPLPGSRGASGREVGGMPEVAGVVVEAAAFA